MKKFLSLAMAILLTLSLISTASAVEIINTQNNTPAAEGNWELCSWLLDENGKLVAQKYREADTILPINETAKSIAGIVGNGKVERSHARHLVTLDEIGWVEQGDSEPIWCKVEFLELDDPKAQAEFEKFGITTCEELEDQLTEAFKVDTTPEGEVIYCAYYRAVEIKLEETELDVDVVARVYVGDKFFHVLLVDYDQDGERELALHLGLMPTGKSSGGNKPSGEKPNEKPGNNNNNEENKKPDPENDEVILPWDSSTGSSDTKQPSTPNTSTGDNTPNPGNDDVKLPF